MKASEIRDALNLRGDIYQREVDAIDKFASDEERLMAAVLLLFLEVRKLGTEVSNLRDQISTELSDIGDNLGMY